MMSCDGVMSLGAHDTQTHGDSGTSEMNFSNFWAGMLTIRYGTKWALFRLQPVILAGLVIIMGNPRIILALNTETNFECDEQTLD